MAAKVYFVKASVDDGQDVIAQKAAMLFQTGRFAACFKENDFTAVKVHIGEAGNNTYIKAGCIKGLVRELLALKTKPFLTDTSALYIGRRHNAIDHTVLAVEHGFCYRDLGIPFIVCDGLFGTSETPVRVNGQINKQVLIASDIVRCQSILSVAHFTGHVAACAAATIKTLGMGCASRKGKMRQHSALKPAIMDSCTLCGECYKHCPADAITLDDVKAHIDQDKCIGCAECVAVCRFNAVKYDWDAENQLLQKNMAEHALGVLKGKEKRAVFFNFIISVAKDCDCFSTPDIRKIVDDIGIVASTDPVAVDRAALDLVQKKGGKKLAELIENDKLDPRYQLEHAERIGLGTNDYQLIELSQPPKNRH
ncbi:MAG TPA: DUF362 domain-containing protein [Sedimentisphaerales bacterium]|nr:DUF362 domain-containing protein [Sedimentisphaerales bacterium]